MGMCNTAYYNVHWNDGGTLTYTGSAPDEYTTSIVGNRTVRFIHEVAGASLAEGGHPFLAVAATRAPHGPQTPAPVRLHRTSSRVELDLMIAARYSYPPR